MPLLGAPQYVGPLLDPDRLPSGQGPRTLGVDFSAQADGRLWAHAG